MADIYENYMVGQYVKNLVAATPYTRPLADYICTWLTDEGASLNLIEEVDDPDEIDIDNEDNGALKICFSEGSPPLNKRRKPRGPVRHRRRMQMYSTRNISKQKWKLVREHIISTLDATPAPSANTFAKNIHKLAQDLRLSRAEKSVLTYVGIMRSNRDLGYFCNELFGKNRLDYNAMLATACGFPASKSVDFSAAIKHLHALGILESNTRGHVDFDDKIEIADNLFEALAPVNTTRAEIYKSLFGTPVKSSLRWDDFAHIATERDLVGDLVKGACKTGTQGVNILLYGPPGTGKTEMAKTLASKLKFKLYAIGEADSDGDAPSLSERICAHKLAQRLLAKRKDTVLLFDEMEDLLPGRGFFGMRSGGMPKVYMNRMLENNSLPVIWTSNDIDRFDPALLRRLTLAVEVKTPPAKIRARVWKRTLQRSGVKLPAKEVDKLAKKHDVSPALVDNAIKVAKLSGRSGAESIELVVNSIDKAMTGGRTKAPETNTPHIYMPKLENTDTDLHKLTERLNGGTVEQGFSLLLYGPSGTGKSAYARHLAEQMGLDVLFKRASELLSMWVGGSEKNIAAAFAKARENNALLIFDEADSLLADRRGAHNSWEVTQVNEMLTWMESHPLPFVCTTNLKDNLDAASMRRFTFKVGYNYLNATQRELAFAHFFGTKPHDSALMAMAQLTLTPGDFAVVAKKANILGETNPAILAQMLETEHNNKPDKPANAMGFMA